MGSLKAVFYLKDKK